ncbi:MAG: hypothetical protein N2482_01820 [Patescibacteria group bacterium]|nr:hypothetical protein [Patescibacteria group bacterium]
MNDAEALLSFNDKNEARNYIIEGVLKVEARKSPDHPRQDFWGCALTQSGDTIVFVADGVSRPFSGRNRLSIFKDCGLFDVSPDGRNLQFPKRDDNENDEEEDKEDFKRFSNNINEKAISLNPPRALAEKIFLKLSQTSVPLTQENIIDILNKIMEELKEDPLLKRTLDFFAEINPISVESRNNPLLIASALGLVVIPKDDEQNLLL